MRFRLHVALADPLPERIERAHGIRRFQLDRIRSSELSKAFFSAVRSPVEPPGVGSGADLYEPAAQAGGPLSWLRVRASVTVAARQIQERTQFVDCCVSGANQA